MDAPRQPEAPQPPPPEPPAAEAPQPPPPPAVVDIPAPGTPVAVNVPGVGVVVPMTRQQERALRQRGEELSSQLRSAQGRREGLVRELDGAGSPAVRAGLEERIRFLDERLVSLEKDIAANGELRASLAAKLATTSANEPPPPPPNRGPITGTVAFFLLLPVSFALTRLLWRRASRPRVAPVSPQTEARFTQLEQAIDTVAIEIERVAEGQRFVTKLLREGQPIPDFLAGRQGDAVGVHRGPETAR